MLLLDVFIWINFRTKFNLNLSSVKKVCKNVSVAVVATQFPLVYAILGWKMCKNDMGENLHVVIVGGVSPDIVGSFVDNV